MISPGRFDIISQDDAAGRQRDRRHHDFAVGGHRGHIACGCGHRRDERDAGVGDRAHPAKSASRKLWARAASTSSTCAVSATRPSCSAASSEAFWHRAASRCSGADRNGAGVRGVVGRGGGCRCSSRPSAWCSASSPTGRPQEPHRGLRTGISCAARSRLKSPRLAAGRRCCHDMLNEFGNTRKFCEALLIEPPACIPYQLDDVLVGCGRSKLPYCSLSFEISSRRT